MKVASPQTQSEQHPGGNEQAPDRQAPALQQPGGRATKSSASETPVSDKPVSETPVSETSRESQDSQSPQHHIKTWPATLALSFEYATVSGLTRTVMRSRHTGPLLVQRPFYPDGATCHTVVLHPPAGIVGGDSLDIQLNCAEQASALITTPGATRFYGSDGRTAKQRQQIDVTGGSVEWLPQETIYFDQCVARQELVVDIDQSSRFIGWDINCFGRLAGNHPYVSGQSIVTLRLFCCGLPVLQERLVVEGENDVQRSSGLRGATVSGTMLAIAPSVDSTHWLEMVRQVLPSTEFAATQLDCVLVVRYLGANVEGAKNGFVEVWKALRPLIMNKPSVAPRIWAT